MALHKPVLFNQNSKQEQVLCLYKGVRRRRSFSVRAMYESDKFNCDLMLRGRPVFKHYVWASSVQLTVRVSHKSPMSSGGIRFVRADRHTKDVFSSYSNADLSQKC